MLQVLDTYKDQGLTYMRLQVAQFMKNSAASVDFEMCFLKPKNFKFWTAWPFARSFQNENFKVG